MALLLQFNQINKINKNIGIIIQARLGSSRFPKKIFKEILGKKIIEYLLERLINFFKRENIVISTTDLIEDLPIINLAKEYEINYYRGSSEDVLNRYYETAKKFRFEHIVRITSDCPLIESNLVKKLINFYLENKYDHVFLDDSYAEGLDCEIFSFEALKKANYEAIKKSEREHVTLFFRNNEFKKFAIKNLQDDSRFRITLDYNEDFIVLKEIIENLYPIYGVDLDFIKIKEYLIMNNKVFNINNKILRNDGLKISFESEKNESIKFQDK